MACLSLACEHAHTCAHTLAQTILRHTRIKIYLTTTGIVEDICNPLSTQEREISRGLGFAFQ